VGTAGIDILSGPGGNDRLTGLAGADLLDGVDTVNYDGAAQSVGVDLLFNKGSAGDALGDTLLGFENVTGSAFWPGPGRSAGNSRHTLVGRGRGCGGSRDGWWRDAGRAPGR